MRQCATVRTVAPRTAHAITGAVHDTIKHPSDVCTHENEKKSPMHSGTRVQDKRVRASNKCKNERSRRVCCPRSTMVTVMKCTWELNPKEVHG